jgi:hypothetical protein
MRASQVTALLFTALAAGCGAANHAGESRTPAPASTLLIQSRGEVMPLRDAVHQIAFRPFLPSLQIAQIAVIPPLGGIDSRKSHGIAIEYESAGDALLLSQWPRAGFAIRVASLDLDTRPCTAVTYKTDGYLWTTRNGLVMTLQPDGTVAPSRIAREAHRLLRAGACMDRG